MSSPNSKRKFPLPSPINCWHLDSVWWKKCLFPLHKFPLSLLVCDLDLTLASSSCVTPVVLSIFFPSLYLSSKRNADMGVVSIETHFRQRWCQCCAVSCICLSGCNFFIYLSIFVRETEVCSISWACILTICQAAYISVCVCVCARQLFEGY